MDEHKFHCPKCSTLWIENEVKWVFDHKVSCPFCFTKWPVAVELDKGQIKGTILTGVHSGEEIK